MAKIERLGGSGVQRLRLLQYLQGSDDCDTPSEAVQAVQVSYEPGVDCVRLAPSASGVSV